MGISRLKCQKEEKKEQRVLWVFGYQSIYFCFSEQIELISLSNPKKSNVPNCVSRHDGTTKTFFSSDLTI